MADIYHIWADKKKGISDIDFAKNMRKFLQHLVDEGKMNSFRVTRCKLGFRSIQDLPEWHMMMEFDNMAQLDKAFERVVPRKGELEKEHISFNKFVENNIQHALYRDWPDAINQTTLTETQKQYTIKEVTQKQYTIKELVEATKNIAPELWNK